MSEQFKQGDTVEFNDAYTGELTYGRVSRVYGSDCIITKITKEEAGPKPKRFNAQPGCSYVEDENGTPICHLHRKPLVAGLQETGMNEPGLGHIRGGVCQVSGKAVLLADGM
jgi:hypothetical protein